MWGTRDSRAVSPAWAVWAVAGWLALFSAACGRSAPDSPQLEGVILIMLDTLRADHLSAAGHPVETTPTLDALARRGVFFEQAISNAPWTLPAMISLVTASVPSQAVYRPEKLRRSGIRAIQRAGIETAAFTEGGFFSAHFGFDRGFSSHDELPSKVRLKTAKRPLTAVAGGIEQTFARAAAWLRQRTAGERFFLLVHTYEPHAPYRRAHFSSNRKRGQLGETFEIEHQTRIHNGELELGFLDLVYLSALYDGGVRESDEHIATLLAVLDELGLSERIAIVVSSDHGEDLGRRDPRRAGGHGHSLYDELLRIPLVIANPLEAYPVQRVTSQVRLMDVLPTIVDLLGLPPLSDADGKSLLPMMRGSETGDRPAFSQVTRKGAPRAAVRLGGFKLIRELGDTAGDVALYDLQADPGERRDVSGVESERVRELGALLDSHLAQLDARGRLDFSMNREGMPDALRDQLRGLGYIE